MSQVNKSVISYKEVIITLPYMLINLSLCMMSLVFTLVTLLAEDLLSALAFICMITISSLLLIQSIKCLVSKNNINFTKNFLLLNIGVKLGCILNTLNLLIISISVNDGIDEWLIDTILEILPVFLIILVLYLVTNKIIRNNLYKYLQLTNKQV